MDEQIYTRVMMDFSKGIIDDDMMMKAIVLAEGDEEKAVFIYIKMMVDRYSQENDISYKIGRGVKSIFSRASTLKHEIDLNKYKRIQQKKAEEEARIRLDEEKRRQEERSRIEAQIKKDQIDNIRRENVKKWFKL